MVQAGGLLLPEWDRRQLTKIGGYGMLVTVAGVQVFCLQYARLHQQPVLPATEAHKWCGRAFIFYQKHAPRAQGRQ